MLAEPEPAPTGNLVFHELLHLMAEASQLVFAHPQAAIETLALAWEQFLEAEEVLVLVLELVPEEALASLPVPARIREAEVVDALA